MQAYDKIPFGIPDQHTLYTETLRVYKALVEEAKGFTAKGHEVFTGLEFDFLKQFYRSRDEQSANHKGF